MSVSEWAEGKRQTPAWQARKRPVGLRLVGKAPGGYSYVSQPSSPMANARGLVLEHRWVMSQHLGRDLLPTENVHHLNGVRTDNRLENLELWVRVQPYGQRARDLVSFARGILDAYGSDVDAGKL